MQNVRESTASAAPLFVLVQRARGARKLEETAAHVPPPRVPYKRKGREKPARASGGLGVFSSFFLFFVGEKNRLAFFPLFFPHIVKTHSTAPRRCLMRKLFLLLLSPTFIPTRMYRFPSDHRSQARLGRISTVVGDQTGISCDVGPNPSFFFFFL